MIDQMIAAAGEAHTAALEEGKNPAEVLFREIWDASTHDPEVLTVLVAHLLMRIVA